MTLLHVVLAALCVLSKGEVLYQPEQVHISLTGNPSEMSITWVTLQKTNSSIVEYGKSNINYVAKGREIQFKDGGSEKRNLFMHKVIVTNLDPGETYMYHVGGPAGWSDIFYFKAMKEGNNWSPRFAVYGDMGNVNAQSLGRLQEETQRGHFDAILHVGDFAYNMDTDNARVGDAFMKQIQSVAAYLPYMTSVGNHEEAYNFSNYKARFSMPGGDGQGMFYSFDIGPAHIISFSSEFYYYVQYGWTQIVEQYKWLIRDLEIANQPQNRSKRPWLITMCHRPLYCSNKNDPEHCTNKENIIREGLPIYNSYSIESLLYKYGVDLHFQAHEHSYERMWPVFNSTVCNGSSSAPYTNPRAPVHVVTGSAGCQEGVDPFEPFPWPYSAFHSDDYGYTRMTIFNNTHLYMEQVSDDKEGEIIDKMMLIKEKHGQGLYDCHVNS